MRKSELVSRVRDSAFGGEFSEALLETWIQAGLVPAGERGRNEGQSPQWDYGPTHYRCCLQVLRFRLLGCRHTDSIRLAQFTSGYWSSERLPQAALAREFDRYQRKLIARIERNQGATSRDKPTARQRAGLRKSIGTADRRFVRAKLAFSGDAAIELVRWAHASQLIKSAEAENVALPAALAQLPSALVSTFRKMITDALGGMLAPGLANKLSPAAQEIHNAAPSEFKQAVELFSLFRLVASNAEIILKAVDLPMSSVGEAFASVGRAAGEPEWRALILAFCVRVVRAHRSSSTFDIIPLVRDEQMGFSITKILALFEQLRGPINEALNTR